MGLPADNFRMCRHTVRELCRAARAISKPYRQCRIYFPEPPLGILKGEASYLRGQLAPQARILKRTCSSWDQNGCLSSGPPKPGS
jgi:hypothetical protein